MRATIDRDIIVHLTPHGDTEIGDIPMGVGLERLRWDGKRVVDLADLEEIWVRYIPPDIYELHAVQVPPESQLVRMRYSDRHRLTVDGGVIRLKTDDELVIEQAASEYSMLKARLRADMSAQVGDLADQHAYLAKLVYLLARAVIGNDQAAAGLLAQVLPDLEATYPQDRLAAEISAVTRAIREQMGRYYEAKAEISERAASRGAS